MINVKLLVLFFCLENICESFAEYCEICPSHTLCIYKNPGPSITCKFYDKTALLTKEDVQNIINKINQRRNFVALGLARGLPGAANMNKVEWSEELATSAQRWADQCDAAVHPDSEDLCRDLANAKVGQNIATITGASQGLNVKSFVETWYMAALDYTGSVTYYNQSRESKTNYFTQLIWAETKFVGCGKVRFSIDHKNTMVDRLVCNFAPKGNIRGKPVYTIGYAATQCNENSERDETYNGLCRPTHITTTKRIQTPAVSSLLRIINLPKSSMKQNIDPIRNDFKNQDMNQDTNSIIRHQKMRHISNISHVIRHELPMKPQNIHLVPSIPPRHDVIPFQHTIDHLHNMHGAVYKSRSPIEHYRRHDYVSQSVSPYYGFNFRRHGQCTRRSGVDHSSNPYSNYNKAEGEQCTRAPKGNEHILTTQPPCQKPLEPCECNTQKTTCLPSTTQCTCNLNCHCVTFSNYAPVKHRRIPGEYSYYDNIPDFGYHSSDEVEVKNLLKHSSNSFLTTLPSPTTKDYESEYYTQKETFDFNTQKVSKQFNYRRNFENRKFPYGLITFSQRQKRQIQERFPHRPFWQVDDYEKQSQLKSLRYTTLANNKRRKIITTVPSRKIRTNTESITIKVKDEYNYRHDITEKFLSFDELMHLRKNSGGDMGLRRGGGAAVNKTITKSTETTVPTVTNPIYKPLKYCSRKMTCTWTAPTVTNSDGQILTERHKQGSRTPPGYVEGCTRTSTCTREYMNRNKLANATDVSGESTPEDEDYCERRSLDLKRKDFEDTGTVQTINIYEPSTVNPTLVTDSMKFENTTEIESDCSCDNQDSREKRSICLNRDKCLTENKTVQSQRYFKDLCYLVLGKILRIWETTRKQEKNDPRMCLCNTVGVHRYNHYYLFPFLYILSILN